MPPSSPTTICVTSSRCSPRPRSVRAPAMRALPVMTNADIGPRTRADHPPHDVARPQLGRQEVHDRLGQRARPTDTDALAVRDDPAGVVHRARRRDERCPAKQGWQAVRQHPRRDLATQNPPRRRQPVRRCSEACHQTALNSKLTPPPPPHACDTQGQHRRRS
jgi:hypothetical protein